MSGDSNDNGCTGSGDTIELLRSRVKSLKADPLHSHAYLQGLKTYLDKPKAVSQQKAISTYSPPQQILPFAYTFDLSQPTRALPTVYRKAADFQSKYGTGKDTSEDPRIVFFTGYPSPEWLEVVLATCSPGFHFLHRHLDFMSSSQRDWHLGSELPSRSTHLIRLQIPSIVFIGPEERHLPVQDLQKARKQCLERIRQKSKTFFGASSVPPGSSIVRNILVHSGDTIVLEQAITITILEQQSKEKVFIWSDAGMDSDKEYLIATDIDAFRGVKSSVAFCPVFFDNLLSFEQRQQHLESNDGEARQPLTALPGRFGETLNWEQVTRDPILCLRELFAFQCGATKQYMNMMRKHINQLIARTHPTGDGFLNMEDVLDFDYSKTVLVKFAAHLHDLYRHLDPETPNCPIKLRPDSLDRKAMLALVRQDLDYLYEEVKTLIELCNAGRSMVLSSFSIMESKRAAHEARLVTALTKATNRITFIFLPISFVTSIFGMNFRQFGQGPLSIWIWVEVALPLVIISVIMVEYGSRIRRVMKKIFS